MSVMKLIPLIMAFLSLTLSCKRVDSKNSDNVHQILFSQSAEIIINYTAEMNNAMDSMAVDSLMNELDHKLTDINFEFPPLTDLKLTEQENDSLIKLTTALKKAEMKRLRALNALYVSKIDSIKK